MQQGMYEFMRPHLVVYLDIPVEQILRNIKARNRPEELNSPFMTKEALSILVNMYKEKYLKPIRLVFLFFFTQVRIVVLCSSTFDILNLNFCNIDMRSRSIVCYSEHPEPYNYMLQRAC